VWLVGKLSDTWHDLRGAMVVLPIALIATAFAWWRGAKAPPNERNDAPHDEHERLAPQAG
jgi:hypothetical protein